jgi:N-ethylmaleimide reductase
VIEGATGGARDPLPFDYAALKAKFRGAWIVNNGYDRELAEAAVSEGLADAVAFGIAYIANPDLVRRFRELLPLSEADRDTLYGGGAGGYIDYPPIDARA